MEYYNKEKRQKCTSGVQGNPGTWSPGYSPAHVSAVSKVQPDSRVISVVHLPISQLQFKTQEANEPLLHYEMRECVKLNKVGKRVGECKLLY